MKFLQTASYFSKGTSTRNQFSQIFYSPPVLIDVRWQDKMELFTDSHGDQSVSNAIVYTLHPLEVESYLFLGRAGFFDPKGEDGAFKIRSVSVTPNLRNTKSLVKAWL